MSILSSSKPLWVIPAKDLTHTSSIYRLEMAKCISQAIHCIPEKQPIIPNKDEGQAENGTTVHFKNIAKVKLANYTELLIALKLAKKYPKNGTILTDLIVHGDEKGINNYLFDLMENDKINSDENIILYCIKKLEKINIKYKEDILRLIKSNPDKKFIKLALLILDITLENYRNKENFADMIFEWYSHDNELLIEKFIKIYKPSKFQDLQKFFLRDGPQSEE